MNTQMNARVQSRHLLRNAYLYVRQSTLHQVAENTESTKRQYALRQRAVALGWPEEQIIIIDSDQGQSGSSAADRAGFQHLVSEVGLGRAGIVMGLEVSRLARNSADWHRLLEICALSDTLILDEDGTYAPAHFNDRLLLGLKGTMSEAELHMIRARLQGGLLAAARRGELRTPRQASRRLSADVMAARSRPLSSWPRGLLSARPAGSAGAVVAESVALESVPRRAARNSSGESLNRLAASSRASPSNRVSADSLGVSPPFSGGSSVSRSGSRPSESHSACIASAAVTSHTSARKSTTSPLNPHPKQVNTRLPGWM